MRWLYIVVAFLFVSFAAVQFNDPDATLWIAAYLYAALVTIPPIFGRHTFLPAPGLAGYLIWSFTLIDTVDSHWWDIEEAREALGLLLAALWMGVLLYQWVRSRRSRDEDLSVQRTNTDSG